MAVAVPTPPFRDQTAAVVRRRILSQISADLDIAEGSTIWNLLSPQVIEFSVLWGLLDDVVGLGFLQTATGDYIFARGEERGVFRKEASKAAGTVTFTGQAGATVAKGVIISNTVVGGTDDDLVIFETDEAVTIAAGETTVDVTVTAVEPGSEWNLEPETLNQIQSVVTGITSVINDAAITGGADAETVEEFRERALEFVRAARGSGTVDDYRIWAKEVDGVGEVTIQPVWDGAGTVRILVTDTQGDPAPQALLDEVIEYIEDRSPIGATVTVVAPTTEEVTVSVTVTVGTDSTLQGVTPEIERTLANLFDTLEVGEDVVLTKVGAVIAGVEGVSDYSSLTLDSAAANKVIAADTLATLGEVTVS